MSKTIEELVEIGIAAIMRFDYSFPANDGVGRITQRTSFANPSACNAFAAAVRDEVVADVDQEIAALKESNTTLNIIIAKAKFMSAMNAAFYLLEVASHLPDLHESILRKDVGELVTTPPVTPL